MNEPQKLSLLQGSLTAESLMRWGHSMVQHTSTLLVFGGYGGADAHKRLGNLVAVDTSTGAARLVDPSGKLGHASCYYLLESLGATHSHSGSQVERDKRRMRCQRSRTSQMG